MTETPLRNALITLLAEWGQDAEVLAKSDKLVDRAAGEEIEFHIQEVHRVMMVTDQADADGA